MIVLESAGGGKVPDVEGYPVPFDEAIRQAIFRARLGAPVTGPKFSVVCSVRNGETYLRRAFDSIRALDYDNFEVLVQDACSTDSTPDIVREYGFEDGYVREPDQGALDGLIKAAERATGEIIVPCWADDMLLPHALGWAALQFKIFPSMGVLYGDQIVVDETKNTAKINVDCNWEFNKFYLQYFVPNFSSSFFTRKSLVGLRNDIFVFDHDEYEFWLWLGARNLIRHHPQVVSIFRIHDKSNWKRPGYAMGLIEGRTRAAERFARENSCPDRFVPKIESVEEATYLWAGLHEVTCANNLKKGAFCLGRLQEFWHDDERIMWLVEALIRETGGNDAEVNAAIARTLGMIANKVESD